MLLLTPLGLNMLIYLLLLSLLMITLIIQRTRHRQQDQRMAGEFMGSYSHLTRSKISVHTKKHMCNSSDSKWKWIIKEKRRIVFHLPLTIERLVMSVQAGLDIGPAIERVVVNSSFSKSENPCDRILSKVLELNQSGLTLEESLQEVAELSNLPVIRHTFSHLASAQRDGGEILRPLIELADATQQAYQEEIAKLPIKATLPLILTFSGLLICMMTPPILQVLGLISKGKIGAI